jgi:hypothetical protein
MKEGVRVWIGLKWNFRGPSGFATTVLAEAVLLIGKETAHRALATQKKLAYLGFHCLDHSPYSPDLTPSDYHLFPGLKKKIEKEVGRPKDLSAPL